MKCLCPMRSMQRKDRGSSPIAHQSLNCGILLKHARKMLGIASINRDSSHMNPIREVNDRQLLRCWSVTKICLMMKCLRPLRSMQRKERRWGRKTGFGRSSGLPYSMLSNSKNLPLKLSTSSSVQTKQDHSTYFFSLFNFYIYSHLLCVHELVS